MSILWYSRGRRRRCSSRGVLGVLLLLLCVGLWVRFRLHTGGTGINIRGTWSRKESGRSAEWAQEQDHNLQPQESQDHNPKDQNSENHNPEEDKSQRHLEDPIKAEGSQHRNPHYPEQLQLLQGSQGAALSQSKSHQSDNNNNPAGRKRGIMADFNGKWKMVKSEKFEEFLAANGANWMMRKMASKASPSVEITQDGDNFCIKTVTPVRTQEDKFTVGTPYDHEAMGGVKMKVTPKWDGEAIVLENEPKEAGKGKPMTIRREIVDGQLLLTMMVDDVVCKRWFDRV